MPFQLHPGSPVSLAYRSQSDEEPLVYVMKSKRLSGIAFHLSLCILTDGTGATKNKTSWVWHRTTTKTTLRGSGEVPVQRGIW